MRLLLRWFIASLALFVAASLVPGIEVEGSGWIIYAVMAVILGLVNAVVRPFLKILSLPLMVLTLGLFVLVINALTLLLSSYIAVEWFDVGFHVHGLVPAFLGALVVSVLTMVLSILVPNKRRR